jgi:hypothetical protein
MNKLSILSLLLTSTLISEANASAMNEPDEPRGTKRSSPDQGILIADQPLTITPAATYIQASAISAMLLEANAFFDSDSRIPAAALAPQQDKTELKTLRSDDMTDEEYIGITPKGYVPNPGSDITKLPDFDKKLTFSLSRAGSLTGAVTDEKDADFLNKVLHSAHVSDKQNAKASAALARMRQQNRTQLITDEQAAEWLNQARKSALLLSNENITAALALARMRLATRTNIITDQQAAAMLYQAKGHYSLSRTDQLAASFELAIMRKCYRTNIITDEEAAGLFSEVQKGQRVSFTWKILASTGLALMRAEDRTQLITDEAAALGLDFARNSGHLDHVAAEFNDVVAFDLALMRLQNRTRLITDEETFELFIQAAKSKSLSSVTRASAALHFACMRVLNRTQRITDEQAAELLNKIRSNENLTAQLKEQAAFYLAEMRSQNRTQL